MATAPQAMIVAAVAVAALAVQLAAAVDHPVGGSGAWDAAAPATTPGPPSRPSSRGTPCVRFPTSPLLSSPTHSSMFLT
jgi:hypothetical protein